MTAARDDRQGPGAHPFPPTAPRDSWGQAEPPEREPRGYETSGELPRHRGGPDRTPADPDDHVFDIADDRRDDGTAMTHPGQPGPRTHGRPGDLDRGFAVPQPPAPRGGETSGYDTAQVRDPYDRGGYDQAGYGRGGYDPGAPDQAGYDRSRDQSGYGQGGFERGGLERGGFERGGFERGGYERGGYERGGYDQNGQDRGGHGPSGFDRDPWDRGRAPEPAGYDPGYSSRYESREGGYAATTSLAVTPPAPSRHDGVGLPAPREAAPVSNDVHDMVSIIRSSFEAVAPRADELTQLFYGWLFRIAPETRELFPVTMELQRTRLLRALVHVVQMVDRPDELTVFLRQLGRDHRKFGVIGEHYDKVGEALIGALSEIAGPLWTDEVNAAWTGAYGIVATSMREAADAERGPAVWMARVMEHRRIGPDTAIVRVQTSQPVPYLAGQYVSVETPQRPRMWRSMSPANAPGPDCVMEFHVTTVPGGWVSRAIVAHAKVGDVWRIGPPMGQMTLDPRSQADLLMVVGGTGLAPARAIIEQLMIDGTDRKVAMFVGGRTWDALYDIDSLRRMAQEHPWLTVVPVVEDDGRRYGAETGTLGEVVARYGAWADRQVVVAGSPAMVRATVSAMLEAGTPFMQIHYDPYHTD